MLSRGAASGGLVGSSKAEWAAKRAMPSRMEIEAFDQHRRVGPHVREIEPAVRRAMAEQLHLADPLLRAPLGWHQIFKRDSARIA